MGRTGLSVLLVVTLTLLAALAAAGGAWGFWTSAYAGRGVATTGTLAPPTSVAATAVRWLAQTQVTWTPPASPAPTQVAYRIERLNVTSGSWAPACSTSAGSPTSSTSCLDTDIPDGTYRYLVTTVYQTWSAASDPSAQVTVYADTTAPTIALADASPPPVPGSDVFPSSPVALSLHAQDPDGFGVASISYLIDGAEPTAVVADHAAVVVSGEGAHTVTFTATDRAGNTSRPVTAALVIDSVAPAVTISPAEGQPDPTRNSPLRYAVVFTEPVTGFTADDVHLSGPAAATATATVSADADGARYQVSVAGMSTDGDLVVTVPADAAHDRAGHGNTAAGTDQPATVRFDTTAPPAPSQPRLASISDTGASQSDQATSATALSLSGTAEPGAMVTVYRGATPVAATTAIATSTGTATEGVYTVTTLPLEEGTHLLTAVATDAAGNTSAASPALTVTIDTTAPTAPSPPDLQAASDTGTSSTDDITMDATPTFGGTADTADTGVTVTLLEGTAPLGRADAAAGTYTVTSTALVDGVQRVTAVATDLAGNTSPASAATVVTVDTAAPAPTADAPVYSAGTGTAQLTGTAGTSAGDTASVTVTTCKANAFPCTPANTLDTRVAAVNPTGTWTATTGDLRTCLLGGLLGLICTGPGPVYLQVVQTDLAGHTGTSPARAATFS